MKIYQLQRINEVINHDEKSDNDYSTYDVKMNVIAEYEEIHPYNDVHALCEDLWDACNVDCWNSDWHEGQDVVKENTITHPTSVFPGFCNSDIVIETKDGLYRAESFGWNKVKSLEDATYRIIYTYTFINWRDIRNKSDFDEKKFDEVIEKIEEEYKNK